MGICPNPHLCCILCLHMDIEGTLRLVRWHSCSGNWFGPFVNALGVSSKVFVQGGLQVWLLWDEGLPCARHGQARPVPQQIHHRPQLSPPSQDNQPLWKHSCIRSENGRKGKKKEKQEETPNSKEERVLHGEAPLSQRTEADEGPVLEEGMTAHRSPAPEKVLLMRLCGQQVSPHCRQYYSKLQFSANGRKSFSESQDV